MNDGSAANSFVYSLKRVFSQPAFLAAFIVLFVAALTLNAATQYLKLYFKKEPVPLPKPLEQIPPTLGPWVQVSVDQTLNPEMLDVLGTKQFIFRDYVDSTKVSAKDLEKFKTAPEGERAALFGRIQHDDPTALIRIAVTYY